MEYRQALKSGPAAKLLAKQKTHAAFQKMQIGFRHELTAVTLQSRARKGYHSPASPEPPTLQAVAVML